MKEQKCKEDKIKGFYDWVEDLKFCVAEMIEQYKKEREEEKNEQQ